MAKPRIFVSSTYYDLKHIRASLEAFIDSFGYESVLFESGDIAFRHDKPLDDSCYKEVDNCHMLVLIVGNRYGSAVTGEQKPSSEDKEKAYKLYNSITRKEHEIARKRDIPIFIFVDKNVLAEHETYKQNRDNTSIKYAYVDSVNVFRLLDEILAQGRNNFIRGFENFDDISLWLRDQWAGLFAEFLMLKRSDATLSDLSSQIGDLRQVTSVLKEYSEAIMKKVEPDDYKEIISEQQKRLKSARIASFNREPLIIAIQSSMMENGSVLSPTGFFHQFNRSTDISDFFERIGLTGEPLTRFASNHYAIAAQDFQRLKETYKHRESVASSDESNDVTVTE
jgi:hypothetical protein